MFFAFFLIHQNPARDTSIRDTSLKGVDLRPLQEFRRGGRIEAGKNAGDCGARAMDGLGVMKDLGRVPLRRRGGCRGQG